MTIHGCSNKSTDAEINNFEHKRMSIQYLDARFLKFKSFYEGQHLIYFFVHNVLVPLVILKKKN